MAHNLEINNGVASFASTQTAWHGLGQIVDGAMTAQQAIKLANLDYEVVKVPNYAYYNGEFLDTPSSFSTLRTDTNQILGDRIGKNYTIVQNSEAFDFFDNITGRISEGRGEQPAEICVSGHDEPRAADTTYTYPGFQ